MSKYRIIDGLKTESGSPYLLGAELDHAGCNFAIFSKNATQVTLLLFNHYKDKEPSHIIPFDKRYNKTGDIWHIYIYGIKEGQCYGYSIDGPYEPLKGHRFNKNKLLIDPYSKAVSGNYHWDKYSSYGYDPEDDELDLSFSEICNFDTEIKSIVIDDNNFDWEDDKPLRIDIKDTIIYELHVRGYTYDKSSGVKNKGTFLGLIEKIPYLKSLGITAVELLPVQEFNDQENINIDPITNKRLKQFWGYSTLAFFAPDSWYSTNNDGLTAVYEFKTMVKEFHKAGIEVILDVVYNHTGEGNELGPTLSFRGIDNSIYYMLENGRYYKNYSGCGNTLNCNHPVVKHLIKDSLRYWVSEMHVDGFRFDLAAILGRDQNGKWVPDYSILTEISEDPLLSGTKLIAESWDAAGLYTVGKFPKGWYEWNGRFRDCVRSFVKGDNGRVEEMRYRLTGSEDIFTGEEKTPYHSINFITSHDGFTINDLVSYNEKHNIRNGENNNDGDNNNFSWNCGVEGPTDDPKILELRRRQIKNFFTILFISLGTPMILGGDEFLFSKMGNNNTYCHDNELNWLDWTLLKKNKDIYEFVKYLIDYRKSKKYLKYPEKSEFIWHGVELYKPDLSEYSHSIALQIKNPEENIYIAINAYWEKLDFKLPLIAKSSKWKLLVDTNLDVDKLMESRFIKNKDKYTVPPRSLIILEEM